MPLKYAEPCAELRRTLRIYTIHALIRPGPDILILKNFSRFLFQGTHSGYTAQAIEVVMSSL